MPRVFQAFPRMMYHQDGLETCIVQSREEQDALGQEWQEQPVAAKAEPQAEATESSAAEEAVVESPSVSDAAGTEQEDTGGKSVAEDKPRKKRGRPRKT